MQITADIEDEAIFKILIAKLKKTSQCTRSSRY